MAESITVARPYAQAAFKRARETDQLRHWSEMLRFAAAVADDAAMREWLASSRVSKAQKADGFVDVCGDRLDDEGRNFVRLLAENGRLGLLPEIAEVYEEYRAEAESTIEAEVIAAFEVAHEQANKIAAALEQRLGRTVKLSSTTDRSLIGGAIVRAGDIVIDGSVRGRLKKLGSVMNR